MTPEKPRRLGRGLEALISGATTAGSDAPSARSDLRTIALARVHPNPFQPRREFDAADLAELEASLKASGLLQPITVRRQGDGYELIAGERRARAARNLGWTEIAAIVRDFDDRTMLVLALVENLQRANLNAIEEARGYRRLIDEFNLTQQQVADAVGKDRTTVTNLLRVLSLPATVQQLVERGRLSVGHARALLALPANTSSEDLANEAVARGLNVREVERRVRELANPTSSGATSTAATGTSGSGPVRQLNPALRRVEDDLRRYFQTDVRIQLTGESKGALQITFYSADDMDRLLDLIFREGRKDF